LLLALACGLPLSLPLGLLVGFSSGAIAEDRFATCEHGCEHAKLSQLVYAEAAGFDASSGRDIRNFAPDRIVDFLHMRLEMVIEDMDTPVASCVQRLSVSPVSGAVEKLSLDARGMKILSVRSEELAAQGIVVAHDHDGEKLRLTFSPAMPLGSVADIEIRYELRDPARGLTWTPSSPSRPGQAAQLHTQGQPQTNSYWFPCHDFPNERLTTELIVTVPQGFAVSSNGELQSVTKTMRRRPGVAGRGERLQPYETFHWLQAKPHVNYLVSLVVGKFDVVDVGDVNDSGRGAGKLADGLARISMPVYVPPGRGADVARSYDATLPMTRLYERLFDEPYPWARYAQVLAWNFEAGGMENTSATTMHENAVLDEQAAIDHLRDLRGLIAHELGHQWFGDLLTCNTWEHIWLNEGWATYCETLWFEHSEGEAGLTRDVMSDFDRVIGGDTGTLPETPGMASKVYTHPWETFRRGANPYPKGASILHMLRKKLGDEAFFAGVAAYIDANKVGGDGLATGTVEGYQFRQALEAASGLSLGQFFEQWTTRPNIPRLAISYKWVPERARLRITVEQTQTVNADNPAFEFGLPMFLKNSAGPDVVIEHPMRNKREVFEVELEGPPTFVAVNHDLSLLAEIRLTQDEAAWLAQVDDAPTMAARAYGLRGIATMRDGLAGTNESLRRFGANASNPAFLRVLAVRALAERGAGSDLANLVNTAGDAWETRSAVVDGLVKLHAPEAGLAGEALALHREGSGYALAERTLVQWARSDQSLRVRANAARGLARLRSEQAEKVARELLGQASHADVLRIAAIDALGDIAPEDVVQTLAPFTSSAFDNRTRDAALSALAQVGKTRDGDRAFGAIARQLETRSGRVRRAAGEALVRLGDQRGVQAFEKAIANARAKEIADVYRGQLERLRGAK
jgi:aminopeptidase N